MATLAAISLDFVPLPGGATLFKVLVHARDLCDDVGEARASCLALHARLRQAFVHLEEADAHGRLHAEWVQAFTSTVDAFWRLLDAYRNMTSVDRLLHHDKLKRALASSCENVDRLFEMLGLAAMDWRRQLELDMRAEHEQLVEILSNTIELLDALRSARDQRDAAVLLKHAADKSKAGRSALPLKAQAAVTTAFQTLVRINRDVVAPTPPWFVPEAEIEWEDKPFACGSFATVHRGRLGDDHARVIVKQLLPGEGGLDAGLQQSFVAEANLWFEMRHPNVIRMLGACHVSTRPFLVCEEAIHGSLREFLAADPTHSKHTWRLLHEAAQGLSYLHDKRVVHGDLRLSNVLVTEDLRAVLADFGLSRIKNNSKAKSMTWTRNGTPVLGNLRWKAPEAHTNKAQFASDVYSLGMSILEAFSGEPPYADVRDEHEVKAKILQGELPDRPPGMTDRGWQLIVGMTQRAPNDRLPMEHVIERLRELAANEPEPPSRVVQAPVIQSPTAVAVTDVQRLLADVRDSTGHEKIALATRLSTLTEKPEVAQQLLSSASVRILVNELQDSSNPTLTEHLVQTLLNIAQDPRGATVIGSCGGVAPFVELLSHRTERLRRSALSALLLVVKDPMNVVMFVQVNGASGLEYHLNSSSPNVRLEVLAQLSAIVANSAAIANAMASNQATLDACLGLVKSRHADEREAASHVLSALVRHQETVEVLHRAGRLSALVDLLKTQNKHAEDTLAAALETLLRDSNTQTQRNTQPHMNPCAPVMVHS